MHQEIELQCNIVSTNPMLADYDGSTMVTRQYQFQCTEQNGPPVWDTIVSGSNLYVQTAWIQLLHSQHHLLTSAGDVLLMSMQSSRADPMHHSL